MFADWPVIYDRCGYDRHRQRRLNHHFNTKPSSSSSNSRDDVKWIQPVAYLKKSRAEPEMT